MTRDRHMPVVAMHSFMFTLVTRARRRLVSTEPDSLVQLFGLPVSFTLEAEMAECRRREEKCLETTAQEKAGIALAGSVAVESAASGTVASRIAEARAVAERAAAERSQAAGASYGADASSGNGDWSEHVSPEGRTYYYNAKTGESSWTRPNRV